MHDPSLEWIRADPKSDLLNSLEHCLLAFTLARNDPRNWKWSVAAAHSAAQVAMVIILKPRDMHLARDSRVALSAYFEESRRIRRL